MLINYTLEDILFSSATSEENVLNYIQAYQQPMGNFALLFSFHSLMLVGSVNLIFQIGDKNPNF